MKRAGINRRVAAQGKKALVEAGPWQALSRLGGGRGLQLGRPLARSPELWPGHVRVAIKV